MKKNKYKYFIYIYLMEENKNTIKHLVISGGGTYGLSAYGALRELHKKGFWNLSNIQSEISQASSSKNERDTKPKPSKVSK